MVGKQIIKAHYTRDLDPMTQYIRSFFLEQKKINPEKKVQILENIEAFCFNNPPQFRKDFFAHAGIPLPSKRNLFTGQPPTDYPVDFLKKLVGLEGECVFLLRDTEILFQEYAKQTDKGLAFTVNREYLFSHNESGYFQLVGNLYELLKKAKNYQHFLQLYQADFAERIAKQPRLKEKAKEIYQYIAAHYREKIIWVDYGFQFTFTLFCRAAIEHFSKGKIQQENYGYSTHCWLQDFFAGHYFSSETKYIVAWELQAAAAFVERMRNTDIAAVLGFATGDALGFPVAGIEAEKIANFVSLPLTGFQANPQHPYYPTLQAGQYTDNTNFLLLTLQSVQTDTDFDLAKYCQTLATWVTERDAHPETFRWPGQTAIEAFRKLARGMKYTRTGDTQTESCSAIYRVLPLALAFRSFGKLSDSQFNSLVETVAAITHNSKISIAGALFAAYLTRELQISIPIQRSITAAITLSQLSQRAPQLAASVIEAQSLASKVKSDEFARKFFGTGSPVKQMLPLSVFFLAKYESNFHTALQAAVHSFREDTPEVAKALEQYTWKEQLHHVKGGETTGVTALVGFFIGVYTGNLKFFDAYSKLENKSHLQQIAAQLYSSAV